MSKNIQFVAIRCVLSSSLVNGPDLARELITLLQTRSYTIVCWEGDTPFPYPSPLDAFDVSSIGRLGCHPTLNTRPRCLHIRVSVRAQLAVYVLKYHTFESEVGISILTHMVPRGQNQFHCSHSQVLMTCYVCMHTIDSHYRVVAYY